MIDSQLLATARAAFAALDFTAENDRIAALEAERERIAAAGAKAEARASEISAELAAYIARDRGKDIADALLADVSPSEASAAGPNRETLIEERARLNAGIVNLRKRDDDVYREILRVQRESTDRLAPIAKPLIDALFAEATRGAERIADAFAGLDALLGATRYGSGERDRVGLATARLSKLDCLLRYGTIPVAPAIVHTLRALEGKGAALPVGIRETTKPPEDLAAAALIAGAMGFAQAA